MGRIATLIAAVGLLVSTQLTAKEVTKEIPLYDQLGVTYYVDDAKLIKIEADAAYYMSIDGRVDEIVLKSSYNDKEYLSHVSLHELIHWTRKDSRTNRFALSLSVIEEEYVAETGARLLGKMLGLDARTPFDSKRYLYNHPEWEKIYTARRVELDKLAYDAVIFILDKLDKR